MGESRGPIRSKRVTSTGDGLDLPLLRTKLYAPRLTPGLVARPGQMQLLDRAFHHKVTLVSTPPGYGKSTLVSSWLESSHQPGAWISLDEADNDPNSFFRYLLAAIDTIDERLTASTQRLLRDERGVPVRTLVDSLISDLSSATRPFVVVFDDFHAIEAPEILEGMARLITYAPSSLRLVLISRSDPKLPLMRPRSQGELFSLRASDLAFAPEETRTLLCERYALPIDEPQLVTLQSWSEGWPLGLILVGQALQERAHDQLDAIIDQFALNPDFIADYLWRELIERQSRERQDFLLRTSILDQFDARVCNAVVGGTDAAAMLAAIAEANLFLIPLGERRSWFRYHHLFQDVLRERLALSLPDTEVLALHARASRWYHSEGLVEEAAAHAIKAQDWELALQILTPLCAALFRQERLASVRAWLDALPSDVIERDPQLSNEYAWSLMRGGYAARSRPYIDVAEKQWRAAGDDVGIGRVLILRALEDYYLHNDIQGIERCQQSLALLPEDFVDDRARLYAVLGNLLLQNGDVAAAEAALLHCRLLAREIGSLSLQLLEMNASGRCLVDRGELSEAETLFQRVVATGDEWHDLPVVHAHLLLGSIYLDQYRLDLAEQSFDRALELADRLSTRIHPILIHHQLAELAWARHDSETALAEIERSIAVAGPDGFGAYVRHARAQLARIWIRQGKHNLARAWAAELDPNLGRPPEHAHIDEYFVALELLAHDGQIRPALVSLDLAIAHAQENGQRHHLLSMFLLKSVLLTSQGKAKESNAALNSAIEIGAGSGYVRPFLAFGIELEDQLRKLSVTSGQARYIRHLLEHLQRDRRTSAAADDATNPLSKRQTEIMRLVAAGDSNRDIADRLFISEQTVKKHLGTAFLRLDVSSRTQAVEACRRLDII